MNKELREMKMIVKMTKEGQSNVIMLLITIILVLQLCLFDYWLWLLFNASQILCHKYVFVFNEDVCEDE